MYVLFVLCEQETQIQETAANVG